MKMQSNPSRRRSILEMKKKKEKKKEKEKEKVEQSEEIQKGETTGSQK